MTRYQPREGLHVTLLTQRKANEHTRRSHNIPDDVGLGWKPYTIIVQGFGASPYTAFHHMADFRRWLGRNYRIEVGGAWHSPGIRSGRVVAR